MTYLPHVLIVPCGFLAKAGHQKRPWIASVQSFLRIGERTVVLTRKLEDRR